MIRHEAGSKDEQTHQREKEIGQEQLGNYRGKGIDSLQFWLFTLFMASQKGQFCNRFDRVFGIKRCRRETHRAIEIFWARESNE